MLSKFPFQAKRIGFTLMLLSIPFAYLYFWGGRPEAFNIKVFAIVSQYLETRYFVLAQTNVLDELAATLLILGVALFSFSKEKKEEVHFDALRIKALVNALFFSITFWLLSFLFVYGMAIVIISTSIFLLFLLAYNLLFRIYLFKHRKLQKCQTNKNTRQISLSSQTDHNLAL